MKIEGKEYRTIWFENNVVKIIDQTKLPHQFIIKDLKTVKDAINAIKKMEVRGAPLIGATAAYGLVLAIIENNDQSFLKKSAENLINDIGQDFLNLLPLKQIEMLCLKTNKMKLKFLTLLLLIALIEILFKVEFIFEALIFSSSLKSLFLEDKANLSGFRIVLQSIILLLY